MKLVAAVSGEWRFESRCLCSEQNLRKQAFVQFDSLEAVSDLHTKPSPPTGTDDDASLKRFTDESRVQH